jgi:hypothetical protein
MVMAGRAELPAGEAASDTRRIPSPAVPAPQRPVSILDQRTDLELCPVDAPFLDPAPSDPPERLSPSNSPVQTREGLTLETARTFGRKLRSLVFLMGTAFICWTSYRPSPQARSSAERVGWAGSVIFV